MYLILIENKFYEITGLIGKHRNTFQRIEQCDPIGYNLVRIVFGNYAVVVRIPALHLTANHGIIAQLEISIFGIKMYIHFA